MIKDEFNKEQMKIALWQEKVNKTIYLSDKAKVMAVEMGKCYVNNNKFLYKMLEGLKKEKEELYDEENNVTFQKQEDTCTISFKDQYIQIKQFEMKEFIESWITIMDEILPLGSVVDLKKEFFSSELTKKTEEKIRIVITYRFLSREGVNAFFPYAGVVYPTGMLGNREVLYFTPGLIEKVVQKGFEDEKELAFVYKMKREYLIEKNMISCGMATKEVVAKFSENGGH